MDVSEHTRKDSWLSIKSIKEVADLRNVLSQKDSSASSRSVSPESYVTRELKPNTYVNQSLSFPSVHKPYCDSLDLLISDEYEAMTKYLQRQEAKIKQIQDRNTAYCQHLQSELDKNKLEINKLTSELSELRQSTARSEEKRDLDSWQQEYEKQIEDLKIEHQLVMIEREEIWAQTVEEERLRAESIRIYYREQINRTEQHYLKEIRRLKIPRLSFSEFEVKELNQLVMKLQKELEEKNRIIELQSYTIQQLTEQLKLV